MTFPAKEHLVTLEHWAAKQERMFGDACDEGLWLNGTKLIGIIRNACKGLREVYKGKALKWSCGSSWECFVPFEMEGKEYVGVRVRVSVNEVRRGKKFASIEIYRETQTENPLRPTS